MANKIFTFILLFFGSTIVLLSQIITDRPDQTESSSTVPKGSLQLESGILIGFEGGVDNTKLSTQQLLLPSNLFRYGITNWLELRVLNQLESLKTEGDVIQGISDIEIGTKIQLLKKESINAEIAFLSHIITPTGSDKLSKGKFGTINKLSISHVLTDKLGLGYNLGYNYFGQGTGDLTYSIALGIGVNEKVGVYIEPYGKIAELENHISNFDTGFTYLVNQNVQLDFSFGTGLNQNMNYISVGCSWLIEED